MSRRFAALVAIAVLSLSACTNNDAKRSDVVSAMSDAGLTDEQATCVADGFDKAFNKDQLNEVGDANSPEDIPDALKPEVDQIIRRCLEGGPAAEDTTTTDDATTTTAAE